MDATFFIEFSDDCIFIFLIEFSFLINFIIFKFISVFKIFISLFSAIKIASSVLIFIEPLKRFNLIKTSSSLRFNLELYSLTLVFIKVLKLSVFTP